MRRFLIPALLVTVGVLAGIEAAGGAIIRGTDGPDRLSGTARPDELYGRGGNDRLDGRGAADLVDGGPGRDRLFGRAGGDRLITSGDRGADVVRCGIGRDIVNAGIGDRVAPDCEVVSRQLSWDAEWNSLAQHETQVEPDSFAYGRTMVAVFQSGRYLGGGAATIGFATTRDGGRSWRSGLLPGLTMFSPSPRSGPAVSDPVVAYDAVHRWWLASSLGDNGGVAELLVSRSRDGLRWSLPVRAARSAADEYDKEWIVCDNWRSSRFRGRCYLSYMNFATDLIETRRSLNGGRTWSDPVGVALNRRPAIVNGVQPVVRPNGDLVLVFAVFGAIDLAANEIAAARSTDGGLSFSAPTRVSSLYEAEPIGVRAPPFPSVDVDAGGTVYIAWSDCGYSEGCAGKIMLVRSRNGATWGEPAPVPTEQDGASLDHFLPGLAVDPESSGGNARLALLYHTLSEPGFCQPGDWCQSVDVGIVVSSDAGATWTRPQRLNAASMPLTWIAETSLGRMLGDYVSTSWLRGRPVPVFALASAPSGGVFHEAIFAGTRNR
jgi:hypothetical protein